MIEDLWFDAFIVLVVLISLTIFHVLLAVFRKVKLYPGGPGFTDAIVFSDSAKKLLEANYQRIQGTLIFWKNQAAIYERLYRYTVLWTILSGVSIPVLIQEYNSANVWAKVFLTVLSAWTGLIVAFNRSFKAEELYRSFRQCESDYYDLRRRLLDRPETFGSDEKERLDHYFEAIEKIRRFGRDAETSNFPSATI
jgi:hypothetical protein